MQLHFENTPDKYIANSLKRLESERSIKKEQDSRQPFIDLKLMEYWVRFMRMYPDGCCKGFCDYYMTEPYLIEFADRIYDIRNQIDFPQYTIAEIDEKRYHTNELLEEFHKNRDLRFAKQFFDIIVYLDKANNCVRQVLVQVIDNCASDWIRKGCASDDTSLKRIFELKKIFHLSDEAIEVVLYLWLRNHNRLLLKLEPSRTKDEIFFDYNERGSFKRIALLTGLEPSVIQELCSKESPLIKFHLVQMEETFRNADLRIKRKELYLADDVSNFLYGFSSISHIINYNIAEPPIVPFEQIAAQNQHALFTLQLLQNHKKGTPLNIMFYGKEGTGKTELAKALAKKMNVPMLSIGLGEEAMGEEALLHHRLRSMLLAEWDCERDGGFILMDEADLVLNKGEKGLLNIMFENLKVPVIWITNNIASIENSTRRRFDYAIEFSIFGKQERVAIWQSVLKAQHAETMMDAESIEKIAAEIPVMAGSATLAVKAAKQFSTDVSSGNTIGIAQQQQIIREVASSHAKLLGIEISNNKQQTGFFREDYIHLSGSCNDPLHYVIPTLQNFGSRLRQSKDTGSRENLNILLYGPPGTGKTAFANHIAHNILHQDIIVKRASDILASYVGETERNIRNIFKEAEQNNAVLFIDEADSFLENRAGAQHHWEVSQVNEFICQMDAFNGLFIAATNFERTLDKAIRRRFQLKIAFDYLAHAQVKNIWNDFFGCECPETILKQGEISISDFATVHQRLRYMPEKIKTTELITKYMLDEINNRDDHHGRKLGL